MKKFFLSILTITVAVLFCMSGCTAPTSEAGTPAHKETGKMILTAGETNGIRLTTFAAGTNTSEFDSGYTIKATVEPSFADNVALEWSYNWKNPEASWVQRNSVNPDYYISFSNQSDDGHEVEVFLKRNFGEPIILKATTADSIGTSKEISASIEINCVQKIDEVDLFDVAGWWGSEDYWENSSEITTQISQDSYFDRSWIQNTTNYATDNNHIIFYPYTVPDSAFEKYKPARRKIEIKYEQKHLDALMEWCPTFATSETIQSGWVEMTTLKGYEEDMCLTGSEDYALLWATSNSLDAYDAYIASSKINVVAACRESAGEKYATVRYTRYGDYSTYVQEYYLYFNAKITISTTDLNVDNEEILL